MPRHSASQHSDSTDVLYCALAALKGGHPTGQSLSAYSQRCIRDVSSHDLLHQVALQLIKTSTTCTDMSAAPSSTAAYHTGFKHVWTSYMFGTVTYGW